MRLLLLLSLIANAVLAAVLVLFWPMPVLQVDASADQPVLMSDEPSNPAGLDSNQRPSLGVAVERALSSNDDAILAAAAERLAPIGLIRSIARAENPDLSDQEVVAFRDGIVATQVAALRELRSLVGQRRLEYIISSIQPSSLGAFGVEQTSQFVLYFRDTEEPYNLVSIACSEAYFRGDDIVCVAPLQAGSEL